MELGTLTGREFQQVELASWSLILLRCFVLVAMDRFVTSLFTQQLFVIIYYKKCQQYNKVQIAFRFNKKQK